MGKKLLDVGILDRFGCVLKMFKSGVKKGGHASKTKRYKLLTCYQHARNYKVDVIILGTPPYMDCVRHIRVRFGTADVNYLISLRRDTNQIPLSIGDVLLSVTFLCF